MLWNTKNKTIILTVASIILFLVLIYIIGYFVARYFLLPASYEKESNIKIEITKHNSSPNNTKVLYNKYKDFSFISNIYYNSPEDQNNEDKKLLLIFPGNDCKSDSIIYTLNNITKHFKQNNNNIDIAAFKYSWNFFSTNGIAKSAEKMIEHFESLGYKKKNITIFGHSFGGAISAVAINKYLFKEKKDEQNQKKQPFNHIINYKSFSRIANLYSILKIVMKLYPMLEVRAGKSLTSENLNNQKISVIYSKDDNVITYKGSMAKYIQENPGNKNITLSCESPSTHNNDKHYMSNLHGYINNKMIYETVNKNVVTRS